MRTSLRGILSRVERLQADMHTRRGDVDADELVRILQEGRLRAARGDAPRMTDEEAIARGRALRQALREQGIDH